MSHIFGIPHSLSEVGSFIGERIFGTRDPTPQPIPTYMGAIGPTSNIFEIAEQVGGVFMGENGNGTTKTEVTIDNATGKCVAVRKCKSRKRKRRLATLSDIKDLAALKQVLGGGKAFDTWIATRGR